MEEYLEDSGLEELSEAGLEYSAFAYTERNLADSEKLAQWIEDVCMSKRMCHLGCSFLQ